MSNPENKSFNETPASEPTRAITHRASRKVPIISQEEAAFLEANRPDLLSQPRSHRYPIPEVNLFSSVPDQTQKQAEKDFIEAEFVPIVPEDQPVTSSKSLVPQTESTPSRSPVAYPDDIPMYMKYPRTNPKPEEPQPTLEQLLEGISQSKNKKIHNIYLSFLSAYKSFEQVAFEHEQLESTHKSDQLLLLIWHFGPALTYLMYTLVSNPEHTQGMNEITNSLEIFMLFAVALFASDLLRKKSEYTLQTYLRRPGKISEKKEELDAAFDVVIAHLEALDLGTDFSFSQIEKISDFIKQKSLVAQLQRNVDREFGKQTEAKTRKPRKVKKQE